MKLLIIPKVHEVKSFIYVKKIMSKMSHRHFMMKNKDRIRSSIVVMKSMDKTKSQLTRCRVLTVTDRLKSIFKWQIMMVRHVQE